MNEEIKIKLLEACHSYVDERIKVIRKAIDQVQESANNETKSSAGDKYETGRSMMQIEREQNTRHLEEAYKLKKVLDQISLSPSSKVLLGSLVMTQNAFYFIAISMGKVKIEEKDFFVISAASPIGKLLLGKEEGEQVLFNKEVMKIQKIY